MDVYEDTARARVSVPDLDLDGFGFYAWSGELGPGVTGVDYAPNERWIEFKAKP